MPSVLSIPLEFEICAVDSDYEICKTYPHQIRRISNHKIIKESINGSGYICCTLNKKFYYKHIIIAKQFISNPENLPFIDHINRIKTDNRLENLRWVSHKQNDNNRSDQTFVDDIPEDAIKVESYNGWEFEFLYFHADVFYVFNGLNYVIKPKIQNKNGYYYIRLNDLSHKYRAIYYNKFKREYGLI